jgi:EAL domain-containing protein (putative c-di-GMP-specific phosphodiesterase class I)/GGDEF domain-containing protein
MHADATSDLNAAFVSRLSFTQRIDAHMDYLVSQGYAIGFVLITHVRQYQRIYGIEAYTSAIEQIVSLLIDKSTHHLLTSYGGECFALVAPSESMRHIAEQVDSLARSFQSIDSLGALTGYIGLRNDLDAEAHVERARYACELIESDSAQSWYEFDGHMNMRYEKHTYVIDNLDAAIARGEIRAFVQPIVRVLTGEICEFEVLARWETERFGYLQPFEFIPTLERNRLVHKLDLEVFRIACAQWCSAHERGLAIPFGINLSRLDFELCDIYGIIRAIMQHYEVPIDQVHIEITETALTRDDDVVTKGIEQFREAGFQTYMDDFGSGYSSLESMATLDFDVIKVDKGLIDHIEYDERSRVVLADIVSMVKRSGMHTLCEGVETRDQLDFLRAIGCEKAQGYYFMRPLSHEQAMQTLQAQGSMCESQYDSAYFNAIGQINLIDGTSASIQGVEAAQFLGRLPIAVLEFSEEGIHMLMCNIAYQHMLERMGFADIESFVEHTMQGAGAVNKRAMKAAQLSRETGAEQHFSFVVTNTYCEATLRLVATREGREAFLNVVTSMDDIPKVSERTLLTAILDSGARKFFWKDTNRRFLGANQEFLDYYGFEGLGDIIGKTDEDMGWHVDNDPFRNDELRVLRGESITDAEGVCKCRDSYRRIIATKRPIYTNGVIVGLVGFFEDIGPYEGPTPTCNG